MAGWWMYQILRVQNTNASQLLDLNCRFFSGTAISGASSLSLLEWRSTFCTSGIEDVRKRRIWIYVWFQENSRFNIFDLFCSLFGGLEDLLEVKHGKTSNGPLHDCRSTTSSDRRTFARLSFNVASERTIQHGSIRMIQIGCPTFDVLIKVEHVRD